jgi:hypothetical protein
MATTLHRDDTPVVRHALKPGLTGAGVPGSPADILACNVVVRLRRGAAVHGSAARAENGRDAASQWREVVSGYAAAQVDGGGQADADQRDGQFGAEPVENRDAAPFVWFVSACRGWVGLLSVAYRLCPPRVVLGSGRR